jgi:FdhD protein
METELPRESLVRLMVNGQFYSHLLCTPTQLKELAVGWLFSQGIIRGMNDLVSVAACDGTSDINVFLKSRDIKPFEHLKPIITSGCMGGQINSLHYFSELPVHNSKFKIQLNTIVELMKQTVKSCRQSGDSGGTHYAIIYDLNNHSKNFFGNDAGRHNAVDKAIGMALLAGQSLSYTILTTTGRVSSEMALKAIMCGIPLIASQRSVTDLAVDLAEKSNTLLVSHALKRKPGIYGDKNRVIEDNGS